MKITVIGIPLPQGSKSAFVVGGRAIVTDGKRGPDLKQWRASIAATARLWLAEHGMPAPIDGPATLKAVFYLPRPKSAPKRVHYPATKPDLDKLMRAAGDALSGIAYTDDARLVELLLQKRFAIDSPPRVEICVQPVEMPA